MKSRHKKLALIALGLLVLAGIAGLVLNALNSNIALYISPSEVQAGKAPKGKAFRVGGLVQPGSLSRQADGISARFVVTDTAQTLTVQYTGILPDLFKEGKGVVAQGKLDPEGVFIASEVLAKHDENYMPPEAAKAIEQAQQNNSSKKTTP